MFECFKADGVSAWLLEVECVDGAPEGVITAIDALRCLTDEGECGGLDAVGESSVLFAGFEALLSVDEGGECGALIEERAAEGWACGAQVSALCGEAEEAGVILGAQDAFEGFCEEFRAGGLSQEGEAAGLTIEHPGLSAVKGDGVGEDEASLCVTDLKEDVDVFVALDALFAAWR